MMKIHVGVNPFSFAASSKRLKLGIEKICE
jgi:hypothetical protein